MIYILNAPVLTAYGEFRFAGPVVPEVARGRLGGGFVSAIGHGAAAAFLTALLHLDVPANRVSVTMQPGDAALVLRLGTRLPEGKVLTLGEMAEVNYELGWLERVA